MFQFPFVPYSDHFKEEENVKTFKCFTVKNYYAINCSPNDINANVQLPLMLLLNCGIKYFIEKELVSFANVI